ncbi:MAG TPA: nucleotide disphospho-sugar-binding domain-containing protein [Allosphingosinicella sp.]|uniref:glycosyltransferase n=1 Tax=Allosphingosinicella sp. TaxID=2823234 RepID=UPI002F280690
MTFVNFEDARRHVPDELAFEPVALRDCPPGALQPFLKRLARLNGPVGIMRMVRDVASLTELSFRELPAVLERIGADAMIVDQAELAGGPVATALGHPFATVANALPVNREPLVPPPFVPWSYDASPRGAWRNRGGYRVADWIVRPMTAVLEREAGRLGLSGFHRDEDTWSPTCQVSQCVRGLDFPRTELPPHFHYVGPLRGPDKPLDFELPEAVVTGERPLVFCSFGTLQGSRAGLFRAVAVAAADLDVTLLLAHGGLLDEAEARRLPGKPIVRPYVPQRAVLARAAAAVTHAGFNTVMDALSFGVPMVALPIAFEQPATGARLERAGAAVVLQRRRTKRRIREALRAVLEQPIYRGGAGRLAAEIAEAGGVKRAADLVEAILPGTGRGTATR